MSTYHLLFLTVVSLFLAACTEDNNNHGYGYDYDLITNAGIRIMFEGEPFSAQTDFIDSVYYDAMTCTQYSAPPPPYIVIKKENFIFNIEGNDYRALIYFDPPLILVANGYIDHYGILMHEFIHYLLYKNGINQSNTTHDRDLEIFTECGATLP